MKKMNPLVSSKIWNFFSSIHSEICCGTCSVAFLSESMKVLLECDEKLPQKKTAYF